MSKASHLRIAGGTAAGDPTAPPEGQENDPKAVFLKAMAMDAVEAVVVLIDADNYLHLLSTCATYNDDYALLGKGQMLALELDAEQGEEG
jgi:hypothetical protein